MAKDLTARSVEVAKAEPAKRKPGSTVVRTEHPDGHTRGLFLVVQPTGGKSWVLRYRFKGKPKKLTIGPVLSARSNPIDGRIPLGQPHTLSEARTAAQAANLDVARGIDPGAAKVAVAVLVDPERNLVRTHAERFIEQHAKPNNRSWPETERQFNTTILPAIGAKAIADVSKADIVGIRDRLVDAGSPIMANRIFATLRKFFNWCVGRGVLEFSPCVGLSMPSGERSRDRVLSWSEVAALWAAADGLSEPFGPLVRTLMLTGQRREEVAGMRDSEVDRDRMIWTIASERAKNGSAHVVPITDAIVSLIDGVTRIGKDGLIFSTTGKTPVSGFSKAKVRLDEILQLNSHWTFHDIRRTVATGMAALNVPIHVVEAILNHKSGAISGVAAIYNQYDYLDEKTRALTAWGRFISDVLTNDAARLAYSRLRDRREFNDAIHSDDDTWRICVGPMQNAIIERKAA